MLTKAFIPYKGYYSTPFSRWQGSMATETSIVLAGNTSKRWLAEKNWDPGIFDYLNLGIIALINSCCTPTLTNSLPERPPQLRLRIMANASVP